MNTKYLRIMIIVLTIALVQLACALPGFNGGENTNGTDAEILTTQNAGQTDNVVVIQSTPTTQPAHNAQCNYSFSSTADISIGQIFSTEENFDVNWILTNTGDCAWQADDALVMIDGDLPATFERIPLGQAVLPGETIALIGSFIAPAQDGKYQAIWKLEADNGVLVGIEPHGEMPLRVAVKVISGNSNAPVPTSTPTMQSPAPMSDFTLLDDECFDLATGQVVDCNDSSADIKYQYSTLLGAKLFNVNKIGFADNQNAEPGKSDCESMSYLSLHHSLIEGKFFCFKDESLVSPRYGWIYIVRFDENGVSFDYDLFSTTPAVVAGINNPFVLEEEDQVTIMLDECFDVHHGTEIDCSEPYALLTYEQVTKKSLQVKQVRGLGQAPLVFSVALADEPTKSECESLLASTSAVVIWPIDETKYYCYQYVPGMVGYTGWFRPTSYNNNGITFDYLTWNSSP
ncbi:MAG: hypothetical protein JEZ00_06135 [Anaerolineaceae bacterium]|nr:hypothetical protein [Anaerolineaceae bacterium]